MTELAKDGELPRAWFEGATAQTPGPQLTEETLEEACDWIARANLGYGFAYACWRHYGCTSRLDHVRAHNLANGDRAAIGYFKLFALMQQPQPRMRKEFAQLFEGDKLVGQLMIERPFDARDWLPFVERIHPDDEAQLGIGVFPPDGAPLVAARDVRVQRFNLHKGRYVLAGTET